jgi:hypothetical protein
VTILVAYSEATLKRNGDKTSPYFSQFSIGNDKEKITFPVFNYPNTTP